MPLTRKAVLFDYFITRVYTWQVIQRVLEICKWVKLLQMSNTRLQDTYYAIVHIIFILFFLFIYLIRSEKKHIEQSNKYSVSRTAKLVHKHSQLP